MRHSKCAKNVSFLFIALSLERFSDQHREMGGDAWQIRMNILNEVLMAEVMKGHLKWKVADIARKLNVSRSLLYYHFGKSKEDILKSCYDLISQEFYGLNLDKAPLRLLDDRIIAEALMKTQSIYLKNPAIVVFFHRWRIKPSEIQTQILKIENQFRAQLQAVFPELSSLEITALHTLMHGVVTSPFTSAEAVQIVASVIKKFLQERIIQKT